MKIITLIALFLSGFFLGLQAQDAVLASGGDAAGSGGTVSYSIGQVTYTSIDNINGTVNQGVQLPFEFFTLGINDFHDVTLSMVIYPNPTSEFIKLIVENDKFEMLNYYLFDFNGKLLYKQKVSSKETSIPMGSFPSAIYFLKVNDNNKELKIFKIIKN